jgi:hypothetical protein
MASFADGACAFAWRNYLLRHSSISEDDGGRAALYRYINSLQEVGAYDFGLLQKAAVAYLGSLDKLHDDQAARLAADQALTRSLPSRRTQADAQLDSVNTRDRERTA